MIQANELRVGNLLEYHVNEEGMTWEPTAIDYQDIAWCTTDEDNFNKAHRPIPLSEDWLLRLGAEVSKVNDRYFIVTRSIGISTADGKYRVIVGNFVCSVIVCELEFVHTYQNVIFALTGKELTLIQ